VVGGLVGEVDIVYVPAREADFSGAEVSGRRAAWELGWTATTPFVEGVRSYVDWLLKRLDPSGPSPEAIDPALG
jgi:nucleoside-diphosphate-sugar epimerase